MKRWFCVKKNVRKSCFLDIWNIKPEGRKTQVIQKRFSARCATFAVNAICVAALLAPMPSSADGGTLVWARYDDIDPSVAENFR